MRSNSSWPSCSETKQTNSDSACWGLEQAALRATLPARRRLGRGGQAHVLEARRRGDPAARRARDEADLQEERLDDVLERAALLGQRRGDRFDADRAAVEPLADHREV